MYWNNIVIQIDLEKFTPEKLDYSKFEFRPAMQ